MNKQTIVVSGILCKGTKALLAKRPLSKRIAPGKYHLPGGHVEFGEHPKETLIREFEEEFRLNISVGELVNVFSYTKDDQHTVGLTYDVTADLVPEEIWYDPKDTDSIIWVSEDKLGEVLPSEDHDYKTLDIYFRNLEK